MCHGSRQRGKSTGFEPFLEHLLKKQIAPELLRSSKLRLPPLPRLQTKDDTGHVGMVVQTNDHRHRTPRSPQQNDLPGERRFRETTLAFT